MDNTKKLHTLSLCTGYGGIERGIELTGQSLRTLAHVEIEAFAIANLVAKMEEGRMDPCPIWTDLKTLSLAPFRGAVDLLTGGYPCQPFSFAGKRLGKEDPRHLWPHILKIINGIMPRMCFFENVEGHISSGLPKVLSDLEAMGYKTAWGIFSASEVGAPHQRKRVFIFAELADSTGSGLEGATRESLQREINGPPRPSRYKLADSNSIMRRESTEGRFDDSKTGSTSEAITECGNDPESHRWPSRPGELQYEWEPPRAIDGKLNPDWVECLMGLPIGWTGTGNRIDRLRLLGNGVVPQTAAHAWATLNKQIWESQVKSDLGEMF